MSGHCHDVEQYSAERENGWHCLSNEQSAAHPGPTFFSHLPALGIGYGTLSDLDSIGYGDYASSTAGLSPSNPTAIDSVDWSPLSNHSVLCGPHNGLFDGPVYLDQDSYRPVAGSKPSHRASTASRSIEEVPAAVPRRQHRLHAGESAPKHRKQSERRRAQNRESCISPAYTRIHSILLTLLSQAGRFSPPATASA